MKILSAEYIASAVNNEQCPQASLSEVAFVGRSNVGKSSLINSLLNRKKLVKTSSVPGKTQTINFFKINNAFFFADLPGYGFAKVPVAIQRTWQKMIEDYLLARQTLKGVIFIIDMRRKPGPLDINLKEWLETNNIPYILAITKADKVPTSKRRKHISAILEGMGIDSKAGGGIVTYSSKARLGRKELWAKLYTMMGVVEDPSPQSQETAIEEDEENFEF
jgi:GTP-binding protein